MVFLARERSRPRAPRSAARVSAAALVSGGDVRAPGVALRLARATRARRDGRRHAKRSDTCVKPAITARVSQMPSRLAASVLRDSAASGVFRSFEGDSGAAVLWPAPSVRAFVVRGCSRLHGALTVCRATCARAARAARRHRRLARVPSPLVARARLFRDEGVARGRGAREPARAAEVRARRASRGLRLARRLGRGARARLARLTPRAPRRRRTTLRSLSPPRHALRSPRR